jgi:fatty acid desaturase
MIVFVGPILFARFVMMLGNWTQHSFVDPEQPEDELASTIVCINTKYNHKCWNDGYHAFHHLRQAAHYTEYPVMFNNSLALMAEKRTLIFSGIHYLHIFIWLMQKRYDKLAEHVVNINGCFKNKEDVIALMKRRAMKFDLKAFGQITNAPEVKKMAAA